jgi:DNA-binding beta-propeller fold protein YncE
VFTRNHYFTSKFMGEREFTIEQEYLTGKQRRHNKELHGWGTVCGLKVVEHPVETCRDRWVVVEPGTAIDCCGREVVLRSAEYFDFRAAFEDRWLLDHGPGVPVDNQPHTLQFCLRYTECPSEDVPLLFDDAGCDDTRCQPNLVLEASALEVRIDPPARPEDPLDVRLTWGSTLNLARALRVRRHEATRRLYVLAQPDGDRATLYAFATDHHNLVGSAALPVGLTAWDLALAPDGARAYVALSGVGPDGEVHVLDLTAAGLPDLGMLPVPGAAGGPLRLAVSPADGRLFALAVQTGRVHAYAPPFPPLAAPVDFPPVPGAADLAVTSDGASVYLADGGNEVKRLDAAQPTTPPVGVQVAPAGQTHLVHVVRTTAGDNLVVGLTDGTTERIHLLGLRPGQTPPVADLGAVTVAHRPVALAALPGGTWLYLLEEDPGGAGVVQPLHAHRLELSRPDPLGPPVPVGDRPGGLALAADGRLLSVAFRGAAADPVTGGVALLDVIESPCDALWERALDPCPSCDGDHCLVLATVERYVAGDRLTAARIDNLAGRKILPSTELITRMIDCLLEGGPGAPGPPGPPGPPGRGLNDVIVDSFPSPDLTAPPLFGGSFSFDAATGVLRLNIPRGPQGPPGPAAPPRTLTHICAINWTHNDGQNFPAELLMAFDSDIELRLPLRREQDHVLANMAFRVMGLLDFALLEPRLIPPPPPLPSLGWEGGTWHGRPWANLPGTVETVRFAVPPGAACPDLDQVIASPPAGTRPNGLRFRLFSDLPPRGFFMVLIDGDLIMGLPREPDGTFAPRAPVDADHLAPFLPASGRTGDGTPGGTFKSWFWAGVTPPATLPAPPPNYPWPFFP